MKRQNLKKDYFKTVDSAEKAYFLGFIYADGNIYKNRFSFEIQSRDDYILKELSKALYGDIYLYYRKRKDNWQQMSNLYLCNKEFTENLIQLGCVSKKSFVIRFPEKLISKEFYPHFIRGFFDGDGGFNQKSTDKKGNVQITSNVNFCLDLKGILKDIFDIDSCFYVREKKGNRKPIGILQIFDRTNLNNFYNLIYNESTIDLSRKKDKFRNYLDSLDRRYFEETEIHYPDGRVDITNDIVSYAKEHNLKANILLNIADGKRKSCKGIRVKYSKDSDFRHKDTRGKEYKIVHPNGEAEIIKNLSKFCLKHNLEYNRMMNNFIGTSSNCCGYLCMDVDANKTKYESKSHQRAENISKAMEKTYLIKYKDGSSEEVVNFKKFCLERGYSMGTLYQVKNGNRKFHKNVIGFEKLN